MASISAQTNQVQDNMSTSEYVINTNSTHFWVNNGSWLSTNATFTIQSAFDNLPPQGGRVFLKAGIYPVDGILITNKEDLSDYPNQEIIFEGEGNRISTLKLNDNASGASSRIANFYSFADRAVVWCEPYNVSTGVRVTITNIGIDGNRINQQTAIAGIAIFDDWDSNIENNYLYDCGGHGILSLGSSYQRYEYIQSNTVYFTDLPGCNPATPGAPLEGYLSGILSWRQDVVIRGNNVGWTGYRNESYILGIGISARFALVEDNWVWGNYIGAVIANGQFFTLKNNLLESNFNGISLWNAHCGVVQSNEICLFNKPDTGIKIGGNSSDNSIELNKIWVKANETANFGIQETDSADYNLINNNDIVATPKTFFSDVTVNAVGAISTPISTAGPHTTASGNNIEDETVPSATPTLTPTSASTQTPAATSTSTIANQTQPSTSTSSNPSTDTIPEFATWAILALAIAVTPIVFASRKLISRSKT
jgi:predicted secreted protein with PEFG-CTERM motif